MTENKFNAHKIIQHLKKIQFVCEFFLLSKVSQNHESVPEMLMIIESFKFFFKAIALAEAKGIYLQNSEVKKSSDEKIEDLNEEKSTIDEEIDRQRQLFQIITQKKPQAYGLSKIFENLRNKKMQFVNSLKISAQCQGNNSKFKYKHIIGEILTILRPLISIICIRIFGIDSYKSYLVSLMIDLAIILFFQQGLKLTTEEEKLEMNRRKTELITRYLFRKPFFFLLKRIVIQPLLAKVVKPERVVSKLILSLIEMQSSISLTL